MKRIIYLLLGILIGFAVGAPMASAQSVLMRDISPDAIISLTNLQRSANGVKSVVESSLLDKIAQSKAEDMVADKYFAHISPDGKNPWYWFSLLGYDFDRAGENLAVLFTDSRSVVNAWMNSPSHRQNILTEGYTEIGVGTALGEYKGRETVFVVEVFGHSKDN